MIRAAYDKYYQDEKFVRVLPEGVCPETKWVEGSNFVDVNVKVDPRTKRVIMMGAMDNLVKGAAGQAVQNMNLMFDWRSPRPGSCADVPVRDGGFRQTLTAPAADCIASPGFARAETFMQKRVGFLRAHLASETCRHGGRFLAALAVVHACFGQSDVRCRKPVRFCKSFACKSRGRNCSRQPGLAMVLPVSSLRLR